MFLIVETQALDCKGGLLFSFFLPAHEASGSRRAFNICYTVLKIYCKVRSGKIICFIKYSHFASNLRSVLFSKKMLILTAKRILVIDDAEDIREVAQVSLEMVGGWEVLTASSGREGVAKALAEQPDAILLDVMMPDQDGPTTFLQLQANNATQHIPVILLTAKALAGDRRMFADLGVVSVIAKPFEPMFLAAQVAEALGWEQE